MIQKHSTDRSNRSIPANVRFARVVSTGNGTVDVSPIGSSVVLHDIPMASGSSQEGDVVILQMLDNKRFAFAQEYSKDEEASSQTSSVYVSSIVQAGTSGLEPHQLGDTSVHTGILSSSQAPWAVQTSRSILTSSGITGGGDLTQDRTLSINLASNSGLTVTSGLSLSLASGSNLALSSTGVSVDKSSSFVWTGSHRFTGTFQSQLIVGASGKAGSVLFARGSDGLETAATIGFSSASEDNEFRFSNLGSNGVYSWYLNSPGKLAMVLTSTLRLGVGGNNPSAALHVYNGDGSIPVIVARSASSQSANIQEWHNSSSSVLSYFASDGGLYIPKIGASSGSAVIFADNNEYKSETTFASGFAGSGWRITQGTQSSIEVDSLTVRGTMRVYELVAQQIRATNGSLFVSSSAKIATVSNRFWLFTVSATLGTFKITFPGRGETGSIQYNATATNVRDAIVAISGAGFTTSNVSVSKNGSTFDIRFIGSLLTTEVDLTATSINLSGGTGITNLRRYYSMTVETKNESNPGNGVYVPFAVGDVLRAQRLAVGTGAVVWRSDFVVAFVTTTVGGAGFNGYYIDGTAVPEPGMEFVRIGSTSNADRRGAVYITSDDSNSPFIDITDGVTSHADWTSSTKTKARIGKLDGIIGSTNEYGIWAGTGSANTDQWAKMSEAGVVINNGTFSLRSSGTEVIKMIPGTDPYIAIGNSLPTAPLTGNGIWMGKSGTSYQFRVGEVLNGSLQEGIYWNGSALTVKGAVAIQNGSEGYSNIGDKPTTLNDINSSEFTVIASSAHTVFSETFNGVTGLGDMSGWSPWIDNPGPGTRVIVDNNDSGNSTVTAGGKHLQITSGLKLYSTRLIPFDPGKIYKMTVVFRRTNSTTGVSLNAGYITYDERKSVVYPSGTSGVHYHCVANDTTVNLNVWRTFVGYSKGLGATGTTSRGSIASPGIFINTTRYISPYIQANWGATAGAVCQIDRIIVEAFDTESTASAGLYANPQKLGYWSGSDWTSYIDNSGDFLFRKPAVGSTISPFISFESDTGLMSGGYYSVSSGAYGSATTQWKMDATGRITAGGGTVILGSSGVSVKMSDGGTGTTASRSANAYTFSDTTEYLSYSGLYSNRDSSGINRDMHLIHGNPNYSAGGQANILYIESRVAENTGSSITNNAFVRLIARSSPSTSSGTFGGGGYALSSVLTTGNTNRFSGFFIRSGRTGEIGNIDMYAQTTVTDAANEVIGVSSGTINMYATNLKIENNLSTSNTPILHIYTRDTDEASSSLNASTASGRIRIRLGIWNSGTSTYSVVDRWIQLYSA